MSGKLIMKRKLDKTNHHQNSSLNNKVNEDEPSTSTSQSTSNSLLDKDTNQQESNNDESSLRQPLKKRIRCDTPPPEPEDLELPPLPRVTEQNRHLLEAIQLKMLELQNELDAFENDVEAHEEDYFYPNDHQQNNQISEREAEALGFAMCAQETMLFLQREGIPSDSLLYTRLRDALVGRKQPDRMFHL